MSTSNDDAEPEGFARIVDTINRYTQELKYRVWRSTYLRDAVVALEAIEQRSEWLPGLLQDIKAISETLKLATDALEADEDAGEWATIAVLDATTNFVMGHTVRVLPGQTVAIELRPQVTFGAGSLYEVQTESPGIAITDARVGPNHMFGSGSVCSEQGDLVSTRRGFLTHDCEVGSLIQFKLHNHRNLEED